MKMQLWLLCLVFVSALADSQVIKCPLFRFRLSKAKCAPVKNAEPEDCFNPCTKERIMPKDCDKASHCCMHNCRCIMKGAGTEQGIVPPKYRLPKPKSAARSKIPLLKGCTVDEDPQKTSSTTRPKTGRKDGQSVKPKDKKRPSPSRVPKTATTKKTITTTKKVRPTRRPASKKTTATKKYTPTSKKPKPTKKPGKGKSTTCKPQTTTKGVLSGLANMFSMLGFGQVEVERKGC